MAHASQRGASASGRRRLAECIHDAVDDLLDQHLIVALAHHPDHRFGSRGPDHQTAVAVEPRLTVRQVACVLLFVALALLLRRVNVFFAPFHVGRCIT